jgi:hypothetical protein
MQGKREVAYRGQSKGGAGKNGRVWRSIDKNEKTQVIQWPKLNYSYVIYLTFESSM